MPRATHCQGGLGAGKLNLCDEFAEFEPNRPRRPRFFPKPAITERKNEFPLIFAYADFNDFVIRLIPDNQYEYRALEITGQPPID